jgi:hypothetical protein
LWPENERREERENVKREDGKREERNFFLAIYILIMEYSFSNFKEIILGCVLSTHLGLFCQILNPSTTLA